MGQEASTRHKPAGLRTTRMAVMAVSGLRCVQFASPVQPLMSVISHLRHDPHTQTRGTLFTMKTTRPREVTIPCPPLKSRTDPLLAPRPAARAEEGTPLIHPQMARRLRGPSQAGGSRTTTGQDNRCRADSNASTPREWLGFKRTVVLVWFHLTRGLESK